MHTSYRTLRQILSSSHLFGLASEAVANLSPYWKASVAGQASTGMALSSV